MSDVGLYAATRFIGGQRFAVAVPAINEQDAREFCARAGLQYDGSDLTIVPDVPGAGLYVRLITWWRNR